jgi:hypothetical protein
LSQQIVVLVLAGGIEALNGLLLLLDERFRVIVHLDAKTNANDIELPPHASFTEARFEVFWGGFNMMLAVREMIDTAYRVSPTFCRAVMITGDTLPLLSSNALETALLDDRREYIGLYEVLDDPGLRGLSMQEGRDRSDGTVRAWRFRNFTYLDDTLLSPRSRDDVMRKYGVSEKTADYLRGNAETIAHTILARLPPRPPLYEKFYYGESWWTLTRAALDLVIDEMHAETHVAYFRFLQVPDEHFIQTLLGNKQRAPSSLGRHVAGTPVFVDHADPERYRFGRDALTAGKFRQAASTGRHLFARKFDPELAPDVALAIAEGRYFSDILGA